ncbi:hypothetical protein PMG11_01149 [Penicillium brasilianum]|uniref:Uncharacterized protein n=1 Tax=Penicillium brasilianum TaxID=104259 RepID=A0A0F7TEA2_PENBI|nr:hypothetical protein PMG11_01149 [Penicillium brasilianum]
MSDTKHPLSLLDAVRSQLTIDSDSEDSQSTVVNITHEDTRTDPTDTPLDQSTSTNPSLVLIQSPNDREPFPDFDGELAEVYKECDREYTEAIIAAVHAQIRKKEIDPLIIAPPGQPEGKRVALERIRDLLATPQMRKTTRKRFVVLTNLIIRLDHVLFRRSEVFLGPRDTADAAAIVKQMLPYLQWADNMLRELVVVADNVFGIMGYLAEEDCSVIHKYRHMSIVAVAHLRKPRLLEQRLLSLYLELYDEWIHNRFLHMSNRMIMREDQIEPACLALTGHLHEIWEILSRSVDNYATYRVRLADIRNEYIVPIQEMVELPNEPDVEDFVVEELPPIELN